MKSIFTLTLIFFCAFAFAQSTTEIEYNYMKKGYGISMESGIDLKSGYYTDALFKQKVGEFNINLIGLGRSKDSSAAGVIVKVDYNAKVFWYVLPAEDGRVKSFGWDGWYQDISNMSDDLKGSLLAIVARLATSDLRLRKR